MIRLGGAVQRTDLPEKTSEIVGRKIFLSYVREQAPHVHQSLFSPWNLDGLPATCIERDNVLGSYWMRLSLLHTKDVQWFRRDLTKEGCRADARNCPLLAYSHYLHVSKAGLAAALRRADEEISEGRHSFGYGEIRMHRALALLIPDWKSLRSQKRAQNLCAELEKWARQHELVDEWIFDFALECLATLKANTIDKINLPEQYLTSADMCWEYRRACSGGLAWGSVLFVRTMTRSLENFHPETGIPSGFEDKQFIFEYQWPFSISADAESFTIKRQFNPLEEGPESFAQSVENEFWAKFVLYYGQESAPCVGRTSIIANKIGRFETKLRKFTKDVIERCASFAEKTPVKKDESHFHMLVDYQVNRMEYPELIKKYRRDHKTVREALESTGRLIGLTLRPSRPRGRQKGALTMKRGRGRTK